MFPGAEHFDTCVVELPLTYAKKDKERYMQAARFLEGEELIYITAVRKSGTASYARVFVVVEIAKDGSESVHIQRAADQMRTDGVKQAVFPKFTPSEQRFYNATCLDARSERHADLTALLKEGPLEAK